MIYPKLLKRRKETSKEIYFSKIKKKQNIGLLKTLSN